MLTRGRLSGSSDGSRRAGTVGAVGGAAGAGVGGAAGAGAGGGRRRRRDFVVVAVKETHPCSAVQRQCVRKNLRRVKTRAILHFSLFARPQLLACYSLQDRTSAASASSSTARRLYSKMTAALVISRHPRATPPRRPRACPPCSGCLANCHWGEQHSTAHSVPSPTMRSGSMWVMWVLLELRRLPPIMGFVGSAPGLVGDPSCLEFCARRQEPPSRARSWVLWGQRQGW